ncbi:MAG: hypothetical protein ACTSXQ_05125 [Alphaproteobacteria bacterium]
MKYFIIIAFFLMSFSSNSFANWNYEKSSNSIYSVYKTRDGAANVYVIMKVLGDEISFNATLPFSEHKKAFTSNPPAILNYEGKKLVKYDTFFWGEKGKPEKIKVDNEIINAFYKSNNNYGADT